MKTHLVTGGSGFLGNQIARRLRAQGETVIVLDVWRDPTQDLPFIYCDIRDEAVLEVAMRGVDVVHHTAAVVPLTKAHREFRSVNVEGSRIVAEQAVKAGVKTFIHLSSSAVYGSPDCPITNESPQRPVEAYGQSKLDGERAVFEVCAGKIPLVVIRPRTILGEGRLGIFQILFQWILENRNIYVIGDGNNLFQFVHAHDLMDAYMLAMEAGRSGIYNVGTNDYGTLREALQNVITYTCSTSRIVGLPPSLAINALKALDWLRISPLAPWHYLTQHKPFFFDVKPLLDLGWNPQYSNDRMFQESWRWFLQNNAIENSHRSPHRSPVNQRLLWLLKQIS